MQIGICSDVQDEIVYLTRELIQNGDFHNDDKMLFYSLEDVLFDIESEHFRCDTLIMKVEYEYENMNGIDVVEKLIKQHPEVQIIFYSHNYEYVSEVYRVAHCFFMIYGEVSRYIKQSIIKARSLVEVRKGDLLEIIHQRKKIDINCSEIIYIRKEQRQTIIRTVAREYVCYMALNDVLKTDKPSLMRCHTGYIVNLNYVVGLEKNFVVLKGEEKIPLGRAYKKGIKEEIKKTELIRSLCL